jgi:diketogulonate reductase-like aldo/keto reductase
MVNQVLAHVGATPFDLIDYSRSRDILVEAYSPVAHRALVNSTSLAALVERYGVTVPQLCIRYCLQLGLLPLPKTSKAAHLRDNAAVDFVISEVDMQALKAIDGGVDYGAASTFPVFGKKPRAAAAARC